ncbi:FlxA-like family protein [Enterobacter asburiae]|uniref:FlxA-like family protein n=1 Tax=Enterobacter asburiae TaxID=61645 RepID=UPI0034CFCBAE
MTTIQASTQMIQNSSGGSGASGSNDIASQISSIIDKINKLTQQLKELANNTGSADEKKKQQELIQTQIKVLQAQLAALQRQQAEEAQKKQDLNLGKVEGVNNPSDDHQIDIYI